MIGPKALVGALLGSFIMAEFSGKMPLTLETLGDATKIPCASQGKCSNSRCRGIFTGILQAFS
jgi:hypothetical protein